MELTVVKKYFFLMLTLLCICSFISYSYGDLFEEKPQTNEWIQFKAEGFSEPVTGVIYDKDSKLDCGMPLGGIDTGCLDIEPSGLYGYSSIFNDLSPRGGPLNCPLLGINIDGQTWVLTTGKVKPYAPYQLASHTKEVSWPLEGTKIKMADNIKYWGHYPILDMQFETSAPVSVSMRSWSPFILGDAEISNTPGAVFEILLQNKTSETQKGTVVFNFPGFESHRSASLYSDVGRQELIFKQDSAPFNGSILNEVDPVIGRVIRDNKSSGRMLIVDLSGDGRNELVVPLKDEKTNRGFLISFQRTKQSYAGPIDGTGEYEYEIIDIIDDGGFTALEIGDINGDKQQELIAGTEQGRIYSYTRKQTGYSAGNVQPCKNYSKVQLNEIPALPTAISEVRAGDIDSDGKDELFFTSLSVPEFGDQPGLYMIKDAEQRNIKIDTTADFTGCALGDFNGDGRIDLAVSSKGWVSEEQNIIEVYYFDSCGKIMSVEKAYQHATDDGPTWVLAVDFDGDGKDCILAGKKARSAFSVTRNNVELNAENAWSEPKSLPSDLRPVYAYSDPYKTSPDSDRESVVLGCLEHFSIIYGIRLYKDADQDEKEDLQIEFWDVAGSRSLLAGAIGDLSGDGVYDAVFFGKTRGLADAKITARSLKHLSPSMPESCLIRQILDGPLNGVMVKEKLHNRSFCLTAQGDGNIRFGADLGFDESNWDNIANKLPEHSNSAGASAAIEFSLMPDESKKVRYILSWFAPEYVSGGSVESWGNTFTHMYASRFNSAVDVAKLLADNHEKILKRIISWQQEIYKDNDIPGWLADSLINILHLIPEDSIWAQSKSPIGKWCNTKDGIFAMNECPRACSQMECIPCSFYGNIPLVYFFPELALSTMRAYKAYQGEDGQAPWIFGGITANNPAPSPTWDVAMPAKDRQIVLNGSCYIVMADRYWQRTGDDKFLAEFWDSLKRCTDYSFTLRPAYGPSQIVAMPTDNIDTEWFEASLPGWKGYVTHAGGIRMAQAAIMRRMAQKMKDKEYIDKCDQWLDAGAKALEEHLWAGTHYLNYNEPETGIKSDLVFGYQLDGEWIADWHGLASVFPKNRIDTTLETIRNINVKISATAAVNYANPDGSPAKVGGYGMYSYFPPELLMLAMNYMYEGDREFGLWLAKRCWQDITCVKGYTWDAPNIMVGDENTGKRKWGWDYYQNMMLWAMPAAIKGEDMTGVIAPGGLVDRVIKAGK